MLYKRTRFLFLLILILAVSCSKDDSDWDNVFCQDGLCWIEWPSAEIDSTVFYVSEAGSDTSDGKSQATAFRTIAMGLQKVKPGGTIRILPGTYSEPLAISGSDSPSSTITIEGFGGNVVLDGKNRWITAFFFEQCQGLIIRNLKITNFTDMGIGFTRCTDIKTTGLELSGNGHKVQLTGWELEGYGMHVDNSTNVQITHNDVHHNGPSPQVFPDRIMGTGINTYGNTSVVISNNRSYENTGGGILVEDSYQVLVDSNEVFNNDLDASVDEWWDGGLWVDGGGNVLIRNNYFHDNLGPGIELSDEDHQSPSGYVLQNNTSTDNYFGIMIWNFGSNTWPSQDIINQTGNDFAGNIMEDVVINDWN